MDGIRILSAALPLRSKIFADAFPISVTPLSPAVTPGICALSSVGPLGSPLVDERGIAF